jgi:RNA polymerase sigma-70 factor (ECF subfamily)
VLCLKTTDPKLRSAQLAELVSRQAGKTYTVAAVRQLLHRARDRFGELLVEEVAHSLGTSEPAELEQVLIDLTLLGYCRSALERRTQAQRGRQKSAGPVATPPPPE